MTDNELTIHELMLVIDAVYEEIERTMEFIDDVEEDRDDRQQAMRHVEVLRSAYEKLRSPQCHAFD